MLTRTGFKTFGRNDGRNVAKQMNIDFEIRSVSDGCAWGRIDGRTDHEADE